jgi:hypothetical protein
MVSPNSFLLSVCTGGGLYPRRRSRSRISHVCTINGVLTPSKPVDSDAEAWAETQKAFHGYGSADVPESAVTTQVFLARTTHHLWYMLISEAAVGRVVPVAGSARRCIWSDEFPIPTGPTGTRATFSRSAGYRKTVSQVGAQVAGGGRL